VSNRGGALTPQLPPRLLFFGLRCAFSAPPLAALLDGGFEVLAVVLPGALGTDPLRQARPDPTAPDEIERLAANAGAHLIEVNGLRRPEIVATLAALRPDLLVVACFPWRLPPALLAAATHGGLNVHPSLLPANRGPEPVFWTLRRGERWTGVTVHRLTDRLDAGPIVAQERMAVAAGVRAPDLERDLAILGGRLLVDTVRDVIAGTAQDVPQEETRATHAPIPAPADWVVPTNLPASWAYGFVRGVAPLDGPLMLLVLATGERFPLVDALAVDPLGRLDAPYVAGESPHELLVRFRPGTLRLRCTTVGG
jgi:methionyl-tRNA formyltransferase